MSRACKLSKSPLRISIGDTYKIASGEPQSSLEKHSDEIFYKYPLF
jgi:hypothetical protein